MPIVALPDGREVEFPDGTPPDAMERALREFLSLGQMPPGGAWQQGGPQEAGTSTVEARSTQPPPPQPFGPAQGLVDRGAGLIRDAAGAVNSFRQGAGDIVQGGAQLLTNALPTGAVDWVNRQAEGLGIRGATPQQLNQETAQREQTYQGERQAFGQEGFDVPRVAGQIAASAPIAAIVPGGNSVIGSMLAGGAQGAATSALQPVIERPGEPYGEQKLQQIGSGAMAGAAMGPAGYMVGRALSPQVRPGVRELAAEGVQMTPGQMVGGMAQRVEDGLTSVPGIGDQIRTAQRASVESLNRAVGNRTLAPIGQSLPANAPVGRDMVEEVGNAVSQRFNAILPQVRPFGPDQQFGQELTRAVNGLTDPATQQAVSQQINRVVSNATQGAPLSGRAYQTIRSELGRLASEYRRSTTAAEREMGHVFQQAQNAFDDLLARTNPNLAAPLGEARQAYGMLLRLENAAGRQGATEGVFTAPQLSAAVRTLDPSMRHRAYAQGDAVLQDLSDRARSILPSTVPDSGTPYRAALMAGLLGGGSALGAPPAALAAGAGAYAAYSPLGQRLIQMLLARQPGVAATAAGDAMAAGGGLAGPAIAGALMGR